MGSIDTLWKAGWYLRSCNSLSLSDFFKIEVSIACAYL